MKHYYDGQRMIDLRHGDSIQIMQDLIDEGVQVDVIITDPPYKVITGGRTNAEAPKGILASNTQLMKTIPEFKDWLPLAYKLLKPDTHIYIMTNFHELYNMMTEVKNAGFEMHNLLVWEKNTSTPNRWYMKNCEYTIFARKGDIKTINNPSSKTVHRFTNPTGKEHPAEKPVDLMEYYITNSTNTNDIVLDPFMGTGTTGVASKNTDRRFIGIELEKDYYNIAQNRVKNTNRLESFMV